MTYRRDTTQERTWGRWLAANVDALRVSGIPHAVYSERARWLRFLDHGYDYETGWNANALSTAELEVVAQLARDWPGSTVSWIDVVTRDVKR